MVKIIILARYSTNETLSIDNKVNNLLTFTRSKVIVKVKRFLTLLSIENVSLVEYRAKYEASISYGSKVSTKVEG